MIHPGGLVMSVGDVNDPTTSQDDPWQYGWRYVKRVDADGKERIDQVPLTLEDFLYPEEGDFRVQSDAHVTDCSYLLWALRADLRSRSDSIVLFDVRIDWGNDRVRPLGPDIIVFFGATGMDSLAGTFYRQNFDARPVFVIEVTSPSTRAKDVDDKIDLYWRAGVPLYIIADTLSEESGIREMELIGYQAGERGYERIEPDERGRLRLTPLDLWIAMGSGRFMLERENGEVLGDHLAVVQSDQMKAVVIEEMRGDIAEMRHDYEEMVLREKATEQRAREEEQKRIEAEEREREQTKKRIEAEQQKRDADRLRQEDSLKLAETLEELRKMRVELAKLKGSA